MPMLKRKWRKSSTFTIISQSSTVSIVPIIFLYCQVFKLFAGTLIGDHIIHVRFRFKIVETGLHRIIRHTNINNWITVYWINISASSFRFT